VFTPVLAKHTKSFNLIDTLAVGVDRIQRSFEPMRRQVEEWGQAQISDERGKLILYAAFVDGKLEAPKDSSLRSPPSVRIFAPGAEVGSIAQEHRDAEKPPLGRRRCVFRLYLLGGICHYIFTVRGSASLKLRVDSAGRTISLFPV